MINKNAKRYKGMTLVELLVAAVITTIVILGVGTVMASGYKSLNRGFKRVDLQRDASYAMFVFSLPVKEATGAAIEEEGSKLIIDNRDGTQTIFFHDSDTKELKKQIDENEPHILIKNVEDLE